ncbi:hypothetical protein AB0I93_38300 [Streptomyces sp. NPDC049967]|uniref:hypothetical protein n=1 Tax=Streptomyces sp. NPDC049967 TaxID=3155658 RepID=UPI00341DD862
MSTMPGTAFGDGPFRVRQGRGLVVGQAGGDDVRVDRLGAGDGADGHHPGPVRRGECGPQRRQEPGGAEVVDGDHRGSRYGGAGAGDDRVHHAAGLLLGRRGGGGAAFGGGQVGVDLAAAQVHPDHPVAPGAESCGEGRSDPGSGSGDDDIAGHG